MRSPTTGIVVCAEHLSRAQVRPGDGVLPDRRPEPRLDPCSMSSRTRTQYLKPGAEGQCHAGRPEHDPSKPSVSHVLPLFDPQTPDDEGPAGGGKPGVRPPSGHVRRRRAARRRSKPRFGRARPTPSSIRGSRRRSSSSGASGYFEPREVEIGWRLGNRSRSSRGSDAGRADRRLGHLPDRFREPDGAGRGRDDGQPEPGPGLRHARLHRQGRRGGKNSRLRRQDLLFLLRRMPGPLRERSAGNTSAGRATSATAKK